MSEPLIKSSFINCLQFAQAYVHWVSFNIFSIWSQFGQFSHKHSINPLGKWLSKMRTNLWENFERTFDEWLRHVVDKLWKKPQGFVKEYPLDKLMGSLRSNAKFAQWSKCDQSGGHIQNKFKICPLDIWWTNYLIVLNLFSMYSLGKWGSAPSVCTMECWTYALPVCLSFDLMW